MTSTLPLAAEFTACFDAQVNGKLRATVDLPKDTTKDDAVAAAQALPTVSKHLEGKAIKKIIFVPAKILNLVVK